MTLGVLTNLLGSMSLREALAYLRSIGVESLELGCGGYPGKAHCDPKVLLNDEKAFEEFYLLYLPGSDCHVCIHCHRRTCIPEDLQYPVHRPCVLLYRHRRYRRADGYSDRRY